MITPNSKHIKLKNNKNIVNYTTSFVLSYPLNQLIPLLHLLPLKMSLPSLNLPPQPLLIAGAAKPFLPPLCLPTRLQPPYLLMKPVGTCRAALIIAAAATDSKNSRTVSPNQVPSVQMVLTINFYCHYINLNFRVKWRRRSFRFLRIITSMVILG